METVRRISELNPGDVATVERMFGHPLATSAGAELILRVPDPAPQQEPLNGEDDELPEWCNYMRGLSDEEIEELVKIIETPVWFGRDRD